MGCTTLANVLLFLRKSSPVNCLEYWLYHFVLKGSIYRPPGVEGVCAINIYGIPSYHERCYCDAFSLMGCQNMCTKDQLCKGYVKTKGSNQCQLATTSPCQPGCKKANLGNVGDLLIDSDFRKSSYEGCFIKGMYLIGNLIWYRLYMEYYEASHIPTS